MRGSKVSFSIRDSDAGLSLFRVRKSKEKVLIHSDSSSEFTSMDWASFLKHHNLLHSMSRRGQLS